MKSYLLVALSLVYSLSLTAAEHKIPEYILESFPEEYAPLVETYREITDGQEIDKSHLAVFYFTSSSVPARSFINMVKSSHRLDGLNGITVTGILSGVDTNSEKHTVRKYMDELMRQLSSSSDKEALAENFRMRFDPIYFHENNITKVPRITLAYCEDDSYPSDCKPLYYMTGDVNLAYFFEVLSSKNKAYIEYYNVLNNISVENDAETVDIEVELER